jgi:nucleotide-binding universal stress UspA family protein
VTEGGGLVVVGTDFSEASGTALTEARRLASLLQAVVQVVHVAEAGSDGWVEPDEAVAWLAAADLEADALIVRFGGSWVELARYATEVSPLLLVVGSHGRSGYQPLTLGSTASRVSVHARCPVVVVSPRVVQSPVESGVQECGNSSARRVGAGAGARDEPGGQ